MAKTRDTWSRSTWCRLFAEHGSPRLRQRITVSPTDIQVTAAAMTHMGRLVMEHWQRVMEDCEG